MSIDHTHDPSLRSWVDSASTPDCDFTIQNLPFGVFRGDDGGGLEKFSSVMGSAIMAGIPSARPCEPGMGPRLVFGGIGVAA